MRRRPTTRTALACALLAALGPVADTAQAVQVDYVLEAGAEHDDNVHLDETDPEGQAIMRSGLGFAVREASSVLQANVSGRVDYRDYRGGAYTDSVEGTLSGRLNWVPVANRLSFTVEDQLDLQAIDRFAADSPDNRQQVNVFSAGPNLLFDLGRTLEGRLEARWIDTDAEVTDEFNSSRYGAALRLSKAFAPGTRGSLNAQWQDVDFDDDLLARDYRRTDLFARYERDFARFDMTVDAGHSRIEYVAGGSEDNPLLRGEFGWHVGARSRVSLVALEQFSDAAGVVEDAGTATAIPDSVLVASSSSFQSSAYRERRYSAGYDYAGTRLSWRIAPYLQRLDYLDDPVADEESRGTMLALDYRMARGLSLGVAADLARVDYEQPARREETRRYDVTLDKEWSRHWSTALSYQRYERDSSLAGGDVRQNVWYVFVRYRNR